MFNEVSFIMMLRRVLRQKQVQMDLKHRFLFDCDDNNENYHRSWSSLTSIYHKQAGICLRNHHFCCCNGTFILQHNSACQGQESHKA